MKKNFQDQFSSLKEIISTNVSTLKSLVKQADNLSEIIQKMDSSVENPFKTQLETSKKEIMESIDILIKQTQDLFKVYESLVDNAFDK